MNDWKFVNQFQPQTLYIATILCYVDAVFGLLTFGLGALIGIALGLGGFGIANEKKWGYAVAVTAAVLQVLILVAVVGTAFISAGVLISLG